MRQNSHQKINTKAHLPEPSAETKLHSQRLNQKIQTALTHNKSLTFAQFMQKVLYTPSLGYYASSLPKIGKMGDFITAPEISPIFSHCLARQASQVLAQLNTPNIIEFGAGSGVMAKDILLKLEELGQSIKHYYIVEVSADLKQRQKKMLKAALSKALFSKVIWLKTLPKTPISAIIIANEVLDAMPFEHLRIEPEQTLQAYVKYDEVTDKFAWDYRPIIEANLQKNADQLIQYIGAVSNLGYETEINLNIQPWLNSLEAMISQGVIFIIDYGYTRKEYYQPARVMGTLRCHYQHRAHSDPFFYPGLQDITAHVDFTAVAEAGFNSGFKVAGFTTQANFLMATGLLEMSFDENANIIQQIKTAQQIKTLTLPDEMGESFKVIALTKGIDKPLAGFSLRDLRHQL